MREKRTDNLAKWFGKEHPQFKKTKILMVDKSTDTSLDEEAFNVVACSCRISNADSDSSVIEQITPLVYEPSAKLQECYCLKQRGRSLLDATCTGNFELLEICMAYDVDINSRDEGGNTPVHLVSESGDLDMLTFLLSSKNINLDTQNTNGLTALSIAIINSQYKAAELLLDHGADPNVPDNDGRTAICFSVQKGNVVMTRSLIDHGANVNVMDVYGNTPIYTALVDKPILTMVKVLLSSGANPLLTTNRMNPYLETVLACTTADRLKMVQVLVENGVEVNVVEPISGRNCLHMNAVNGFLPLAEYLINSGADPEKVDMSGRTPDKVAAEHDNLPLADYFLKCLSLKRILVKERLKQTSRVYKRLPSSDMSASSLQVIDE